LFNPIDQRALYILLMWRLLSYGTVGF
jgi:hypothetical protein